MHKINVRPTIRANSHFIPINMKLTRKQIKETLKQTPIETVLLGATTAKTKLTAKQKAFAEKVAQGLPKAQAYRETYDTKASKQQQGHQAHMLSLNPKISQQIDATKLALEAMKYQNAEQLRALAVHRLTQLAIDDDVKPAQQLKALELIGKITEVALFTERREVIKITDTAEAKAKLIESLKLAMRTGKAQTIDYVMRDDASADNDDARQSEADSLLKELHGDGIENDQDADPPHPDPLKKELATTDYLHSIPHTESPNFEEHTESPTSDIPVDSTDPISDSDDLTSA